MGEDLWEIIFPGMLHILIVGEINKGYIGLSTEQGEVLIER